jgi:hypothetical protein
MEISEATMCNGLKYTEVSEQHTASILKVEQEHVQEPSMETGGHKFPLFWRWFLTRFIILLWGRRLNFPPKRRLIFGGLLDVKSQKSPLFILSDCQVLFDCRLILFIYFKLHVQTKLFMLPPKHVNSNWINAGQSDNFPRLLSTRRRTALGFVASNDI